MLNIFSNKLHLAKSELTIRKSNYDRALDLFKHESFKQSLIVLDKSIAEIDGTNVTKETVVDLRDAIVLKAWNLQQL